MDMPSYKLGVSVHLLVGAGYPCSQALTNKKATYRRLVTARRGDHITSHMKGVLSLLYTTRGRQSFYYPSLSNKSGQIMCQK